MCRLEGIQNVFGVDPDPHRRELAAGFGATDVLDPNAESRSGCRSATSTTGAAWTSRSRCPDRTGACRARSRRPGSARTVVAAGFYQGGAANLRLGEEFHHNRLSLIASVGGWGAPNRHAPLWNRRRVLDTATRLLSPTGSRSRGCSTARSRSTRRRRRTRGSTSIRRARSRSRSTTAARDDGPRRGRAGRLRHVRLVPARPADHRRAAARAARRGTSGAGRVHRDLPDVAGGPDDRRAARRPGRRAGGRRRAERRAPRSRAGRARRPAGTSSSTSRSP